MWWIFGIGFLAQGFFAARILVQWILSERARKVLSPVTFWIFSIIGSWLLFLYGWLRSDFAIIFGQLISYYVYIYNLKWKGFWVKIPVFIRQFILYTPLVVIFYALFNSGQFVQQFLQNTQVPLGMLLFGSAGQIVFTLRFIYQWIYSYNRKESVLPVGFWIISLTGSLLIVAYGIVRHDPVLIIGQSMGFVAYIRNLIIGYTSSIKRKTYEVR